MKKDIRKMKEEFLQKNFWIPEFLASQVYNLDKIGFTKSDLEQELKIVLWKSIEKYFTLLKEGKPPNITIGRYCYASCQNKKIDFIRMINRGKREIEGISISDGKHDVLKFVDEIEIKGIDKKELIIEIDGINILDIPVPDFNKLIFKDYLLGYTMQELSECYSRSKGNISQIIFKVRKEIRRKFSSILENNFQEKTFSLFKVEFDESDQNEFVYKNEGGKRRVKNVNNNLKKFNKVLRKNS